MLRRPRLRRARLRPLPRDAPASPSTPRPRPTSRSPPRSSTSSSRRRSRSRAIGEALNYATDERGELLRHHRGPAPVASSPRSLPAASSCSTSCDARAEPRPRRARACSMLNDDWVLYPPGDRAWDDRLDPPITIFSRVLRRSLRTAPRRAPRRPPGPPRLGWKALLNRHRFLPSSGAPSYGHDRSDSTPPMGWTVFRGEHEPPPRSELGRETDRLDLEVPRSQRRRARGRRRSPCSRRTASPARTTAAVHRRACRRMRVATPGARSRSAPATEPDRP